MTTIKNVNNVAKGSCLKVSYVFQISVFLTYFKMWLQKKKKIAKILTIEELKHA